MRSAEVVKSSATQSTSPPNPPTNLTLRKEGGPYLTFSEFTVRVEAALGRRLAGPGPLIGTPGYSEVSTAAESPSAPRPALERRQLRRIFGSFVTAQARLRPTRTQSSSSKGGLEPSTPPADLLDWDLWMKVVSPSYQSIE